MSRRKSPIIFAQGGGSLAKGQTHKIDQAILQASGKKNPKVLFIPTASSEDTEYIQAFTKQYTKLGAQVEVLYLFDREKAKKAKQSIKDSDIIYVGGGNTLRMIKLWKRRGVDQFLRQAALDGKVLCGTSAGGICWFEHGHSDSAAYSSPDSDWSFIRVSALGFIKGLYCPHVHAEKRETSLDEMILKHNPNVIACDNRSCARIDQDSLTIIADTSKAKAWHIKKEKKDVIWTPLKHQQKYDLKDLGLSFNL